MSKHPPGSKDWWIETALIAAGGVALAIWLWDGPAFEATTSLPQTGPRTLADAFADGCITAEHLEAMRDGRPFRVICPSSDQPGP